MANGEQEYEMLPLDAMSNRVRSAAILVRELSALPADSPILKEGLAILAALRLSLEPPGDDRQMQH